MLAYLLGLSYMSFSSILLYSAMKYGNIIEEPAMYDSDEDTLDEHQNSGENKDLKQQIDILTIRVKVLEHENLKLYSRLKDYNPQENQ